MLLSPQARKRSPGQHDTFISRPRAMNRDMAANGKPCSKAALLKRSRRPIHPLLAACLPTGGHWQYLDGPTGPSSKTAQS